MSNKLSIPSLQHFDNTVYPQTTSSDDGNAMVSELLTYAIRVSTAGGRIAATDNETAMAPVATSTHPSTAAVSVAEKLHQQHLAQAKQLMYLSRYGATVKEREQADAGYHELLKQNLHPDVKALLDLQSLQNRKILALATKSTEPNTTPKTNVIAASEASNNDTASEMFNVKVQLHQVTEALVESKRIIRELIDVEKALRTPKISAPSRHTHAGLISHQPG